MKVIYRQLKISEHAFLKEMLYQALHVPAGATPFPKTILEDPSIAKYIENWGCVDTDVAIVAVVAKQVVGAIWGRLFTAEKRGYGFMNAQTPEISMAILADYRGHGIGTELLNRIEKEYVQLDINTLSLSVDKSNRAKQLYERNDYRFYEDGGTAVTLYKKLKKTGSTQRHSRS